MSGHDYLVWPSLYQREREIGTGETVDFEIVDEMVSSVLNEMSETATHQAAGTLDYVAYVQVRVVGYPYPTDLLLDQPDLRAAFQAAVDRAGAQDAPILVGWLNGSPYFTHIPQEDTDG